MRLLLSFSVLALSLAVSAIHVPIRKPRPHRPSRRSLIPRDTSDTLDLSTYNDMLYIANITLAGKDYQVQLDTGSSDLWIQGSSFPIPSTTTTSLPLNLTYGAGWAQGNISYAPVTFADINIANQSFLDVQQAVNAVLDYNTSGVMGLGFDSLSTIDGLVNKTNAATGRSLLYNLFYDNPSTPNFIAFSLQRSSDSAANDVNGSFSIGELDQQYAAVNNTSPIPTFPQANPSRWNVLLDALLIGSEAIPVSSTVQGAPSGKAVVLLDSGSSYTYAPSAVVNEIYSKIQGASLSSNGQWVVPCTAEIDMAFQFNGVVFPLHPLDVVIRGNSGPDVCVGTFVPQDTSSIGGRIIDWIAGDNFLRSVYSVYDFGDFDSSGKMGNPYVKLLSLVDPNTASAEFAKERNTTARSNITYNAASGGSSPTPSTSVDISGDISSTLDKINKYLPVILAIMGFNALVLLVILLSGAVWLYRRRSTRGATPRMRKNKGRMTPLPLEPIVTGPGSEYVRDTFVEPSPQFGKHTYQPVSMALTDDTFVPPSPAFSRYGDGGLGKGSPMGDRPRSVA